MIALRHFPRLDANETYEQGCATMPQAPDHHFIRPIALQTRGRHMHDVTRAVRAALADGGAGTGLATLFVRHTSASLVIQENADPDVQADLLDAFDRLAPRDAAYVHALEGPDDMPAHIRTAITATSLAVPVHDGELLLGTWQGIYLVEHRDRAHRREMVLHFIGSAAGPALRPAR